MARHAPRALVFWLVLFTAALGASRAFAGEEPDDALLVPMIDAHPVDAPASEPTELVSPRAAPLWVAIEGTLAMPEVGKRSLGAMLLVGLPLDRIAQSASRAKSPAPPALDPPAPPSRAPEPKTPPPDPKLAPAAPDASMVLPIPVVVTPEVARGAVRAALRRAHLEDADARLDAIASRARAAALLPELRLRTMRVVDESQSRSPTSYDPERVTASGGTSLWLEARLTWRLDRIVFPNETIAVERLRGAREEARARLTARVLRALFAWQKARALEESPTATPEEHLAASLEVLEREAELDLLTDGWFAAWQRDRAAIDRAPARDAKDAAPKPARAAVK